ncbi:beta-propeller domain-containing protein [Archangium lansingense]|uniref:Beta-propeller domain-containing protein n=1 Tax=Archangium lansingense TaxID=2995310 RepID=A0ABT4ALP6_9BACT|nr:beta-propeller domain-containing protein [Archangium lansinium]MCY1082613.1 beta-propeller domain-containing protein [Archangium lansinium]
MTKQGGWALALLGLAACSDESSIPKNEPVQMKARMESFESCAALESYIEDAAVLDMRSSMERSKPSYWKGRGGWFGGEPAPAEDSAGGGGTGSGGPNAHTGTNNQVEGVDEADFVKNDGTRIFVLSGQKLYAHRSWPAESLRAESSLTLEGWPRQMFLHGNKVVVFSEIYAPDSGSSGGKDLPVACSPMGPCGYGAPTTKVTTVDVSDLAAPQVTGELYLPGGYHDARLAGSSARLVMRDSFRWPAGVRWWPDYSRDLWDDQSRLEKELDRLMVENEQLIRAQTLPQWLPEGRRKRSDGTVETVGYDCRDFHKTNAPTRLGIVTVASLNLDAQGFQAPGRVSLVTEPGQVYANGTSLYMATPHWWWWPEAGQTDYTYVHKLDLTQPDRASYAASATVPGFLLDQFSMDEHEGVLRVATTITSRVAEAGNQWGRTETTNRVFTYVPEDGQLRMLGQSEELAKGERIFSARFVGDKGYVVTFEQVDPLFTFDLSDPANPRKVGELKIPGFSRYIHPVGDTHLLTVGVHIAEGGNWGTAIKLTLFDVTDMAQPREAFTQVVGTAYSWSEALYDHKAFNYFPAKGLLAIPFMDWSSQYSGDYWNNFVSELRVFRVDLANGFSPVGAISMRDMYQTVNYNQWSWVYTPYVRRSVMADDYVYAITDAGVRVAHVSNLSKPLATTRFSPFIQ